MVTGWDFGNRWNTARLMCGSPPGPGGEPGPFEICSTPGLAPSSLMCNVFTGLWPCDASPPEINLGVANFSFETWYCFRTTPRAAAWNYLTYIGFGEIDGGGVAMWPGAHIEFNPAITPNARLRYDDTPGVGAPIIASPWTITMPYGWHHIAANFDRAGNMTMYVDGIVTPSTVLINANALPALRFYAYTIFIAGNVNRGRCDGVVVGGESCPWAAIGPIAAHQGLLTVAQMRDSVRGKTVQNLATTLLYWDWRRIEGHTAWEPDTDRIIWKAWQYLDNHGIVSPRGAAGTVVVPDLSGNGNDWVLPTIPCYGTATADKAVVGFMADPFWTS